MKRLTNRLMGLFVFALIASLMISVPSADAADGTVVLTGGALAIGTVNNFSYPSTTLNGSAVNLTSSFAVPVTDPTGSGAGWNLTAQIGTLTTGGVTPRTIAASNHTLTGASVSGVTGTGPTNAIPYPMAIPTTTAKIYNAALNTGMGQSTITLATQLAVPANTYAGSYSATLTISIVSGP